MILEDCEILRSDDPRIVRDESQQAVVFRQLRPHIQPPLVFIQSGQFILDHLGAARLHREVGLAEGDDLFGGVGILDDQIAGIAREQNILDLPSRSRAKLNHFGGFNKMV